MNAAEQALMAGPQGYAVSEEDALARIAVFEGPIIVDLDETLYLQNSSEDFLDCACPGVLAAVALRLLEKLAPWRLSGGKSVRDLWRVWFVLIAFPFTYAGWKRRCRKHAERLTNRPLLQALRLTGKPVIIATSGFSLLVRPLVEAMGCGDFTIIACSLRRRRDRIDGKKALIERRLGKAALADALVITDSTDDVDVLRVCAGPCLTLWRAAGFRRALRRVYIPGDYLVYVKRPGGGSFKRVIIEDLAFWMLAAATASTFEATHVIAAFFLFFSLWSVYEAGYVDNDNCARDLEKDPVLTQEFASFDDRGFERKAWTAAIILGAGAIALIRPRSYLISGSLWLGALLATRALYHIYNRTDKATRVWLYLVLQLCRDLAFVVVLPVGIAGVLACCAHIFARWQEYFIYRFNRSFGLREWPNTQLRTVRLCLFLVLMGAVAVAQGSAVLWAWPSAALVLWNLVLARLELTAIASAVRRVARDN